MRPEHQTDPDAARASAIRAEQELPSTDRAAERAEQRRVNAARAAVADSVNAALATAPARARLERDLRDALATAAHEVLLDVRKDEIDLLALARSIREGRAVLLVLANAIADDAIGAVMRVLDAAGGDA